MKSAGLDPNSAEAYQMVNREIKVLMYAQNQRPGSDKVFSTAWKMFGTDVSDDRIIEWFKRSIGSPENYTAKNIHHESMFVAMLNQAPAQQAAPAPAPVQQQPAPAPMPQQTAPQQPVYQQQPGTTTSSAAGTAATGTTNKPTDCTATGSKYK
jgi:hypothetical protein